MDKYVGKKLDGRYEIRELIGIGGMANVYRCYDSIDDREVAIKILKDEFLNNEEFIRRFKNESKAIAVLSHPNIVKVYDVSFGDMIQYIVMEYIDGITLKEYISQQTVLTYKEAVHLVTQVLAALSHAHSKGVVHRDIKPQNVMLLSDGTIKVTDFGIARFSNSTRTMTEQAIGSVHYIAPEQAKGDITDGKTDIYSVGIMMYEMLTGKLPFDGENAVSVALMHLQVEAPAPRTINPSIPEGIEEIILKAIQKQPLDRYQSAQDMLSDIERFRMNPSVRFEYKYLYDKQPTKYVDAVNKGKSHRAEEYAKVVKGSDDEKVRHSVLIPIVSGILIALCIALMVCIPVGIFKKPSFKEGAFGNVEAADVDVPDFVGMSYQEAQEKCAKEYSFKLADPVYEYHADKKENVVVRQEPEAGVKKIKADGTITLYVNKEDRLEVVPNVEGEIVKKAEQTLNEKGFYGKRFTIVVYSEDAEEGKIINTYPEAGSEVPLSNDIYFYVAGKNPVDTKETLSFKYSDYIGMDKKDAIEALVEFGFDKKNIKTIPVSGSKEIKDTVLYTNILSSAIEKDTINEAQIILYVSDKTPTVTVDVAVDMPAQFDDNLEVNIDVVIGDGPDNKIAFELLNKKVFSAAEFSYIDYTVPIEGEIDDVYTVNVCLAGKIYRVYEIVFADEKAYVKEEYTYTPEEVTTEAPEEDVTTTEPTLPEGEGLNDNSGDIQ